jgi:uncharacterized protein (DUF58 family)
LTRAGVLTLVPALVLGAAALLFGLPELFLAAAVCGGLVLLAIVVVSLRSPLRITMTPARRRIPSGTPLRIGLRVGNGARRRTVAGVELIDGSADRPGPVLAIGPMVSGAVVEGHYHLATAQRGWRTIGPLWVEATDPFGLARRRHRAVAASRALVWPRIEDLAAWPETIEDAAERRRRAMIVTGAETDFHSLRRYEPGDDPHRIHWPASTRYQELLVRRFETLQRPETLLFIDTDSAAATPEIFERMVSVAAGIAVLATSEAGTARLLTRDGVEVRTTGNPVPILDTLALITQRPAGDSGAPRLPLGAARMTLAAVVGDMAPGRGSALPGFPGRKVILQFWHEEPPSDHPDVVAIGPEDSAAARWQEHQARRTSFDRTSTGTMPAPVPR